MVDFVRQTRKHERWYVLIAKQPEGPFKWAVMPENNYDFYQRHFVIERDYELIAGPYSVEEKVINKLTGCNSQGKEIGKKHLEEMVRRMNNGETVDANGELLNLIRS